MKIQKDLDPRAQSIILPSPSKREFFLIHGYTGSPTDFNGLEKYLHKKFNATVKVMCLKGHGTHITALDALTFNDFFTQVREELQKDIREKKTIIVGGVSFGGQLALLLAAQYKVAGVFNVCVPYQMRFPLNLTALEWLAFIKKYWRKKYSPQEAHMRKNAFFYNTMHINGLRVAHEANKLLKMSLQKIQCPCLMIHSKKDGIGHYLSLERINKIITSKIREKHVFAISMKNHNIFFSPVHSDVFQVIGNFFEKNKVFDSVTVKEKIAAIVPSYNEEKRIGEKLDI